VLPCHPYRQGARCPHGLRAGCWHRHDEDDLPLGEPLCPGCYGSEAQVLWNALAPELWRRTTITIHRALARLVGLQEGELRRLVRIEADLNLRERLDAIWSASGGGQPQRGPSGS
jgi:hypothetical protein